MIYLDFYLRICKYSISINPRFICISRWNADYFDSDDIFLWEFKRKRPIPKKKPNVDTDFDPIPF